MKMAKASEADLNMAMELAQAFDALGQRWTPCMPGPAERLALDGAEVEYFDRDNDEQCGRALRYLLDVVERGSLLRVIYGMAVLLDPRNKIVDPDADTLEKHPEIVSALAAMAKDASAFEWTPAPRRTEWGAGMVMTDVEIDRDHTLSIYVEADQTTNVDAALRRALALTQPKATPLKTMPTDSPLDQGAIARVPQRDDEADAESLRRQLATAERLALVAGLPQAAQWIRNHSEHAVVWVEDGDMHPVEMLAWVAKERGLEPIKCAVCGHVATEVDSLHPYHQEWDRCAAHSPLSGWRRG